MMKFALNNTTQSRSDAKSALGTDGRTQKWKGKMNNWFEVDKQGLARILERKGKEFALFELIQNAWDERGDRKSTRLNSSHGYISYAVFCLKKKTNQP